MHPAFLPKRHSPVNLSFTLNRYPIRNHQSVVSKVSFPSNAECSSKQSARIPLHYIFPAEFEFQNYDTRKFTWEKVLIVSV